MSNALFARVCRTVDSVENFQITVDIKGLKIAYRVQNRESQNYYVNKNYPHFKSTFMCRKNVDNVDN